LIYLVDLNSAYFLVVNLVFAIYTLYGDEKMGYSENKEKR